MLEDEMARREVCGGVVAENAREEYSGHHRKLAAEAPATSDIVSISTSCSTPVTCRKEVLLLGAVGQYINTAGEILCLAGMSGGLHVSQKNDYPITVLRGHSVREIVLNPEPVGYTGLMSPSAVICVVQEGVKRRKDVFAAPWPRMRGDQSCRAACARNCSEGN